VDKYIYSLILQKNETKSPRKIRTFWTEIPGSRPRNLNPRREGPTGYHLRWTHPSDKEKNGADDSTILHCSSAPALKALAPLDIHDVFRLAVPAENYRFLPLVFGRICISRLLR
jgi:hypothetical protein